MKLLNSAQTKLAESLAENNGISSERLMENAGCAATRIIREKLTVENKNILVVAGSGNNGGDGLVAARKLCEYGAKVTVILVMGNPSTKNSNIMFSRLDTHSIRVINYYDNKDFSAELICSADIIIDAVFGIGFHGASDRDISYIIGIINSSPAKVVSFDIPSGVNCDSGVVSGIAVKADITTSFIGYKPCNFIFPAADYCGEVICVSIGIAEQLINDFTADIMSVQSAKKKLSVIPKNANKGTKGTALIVAGSYGMAGAACFSANAAMRSGAGIVRLCLPKCIYPIAAVLSPETVFVPADDEKGFIVYENLDTTKLLNGVSSVLIGPGMGNTEKTYRVLQKILDNTDKPIVIDADGLNAVSRHIEQLSEHKGTVIVTPHPGEMSRLTGKTVEEIENNRIECAVEFAEKYNVITLLKGAYTIIASPDGRLAINITGNEGMATAGSGDMLSGMIAAFLANKTEPFTAVSVAACLHGATGDYTAQNVGKRGMTASDMIKNLPDVLN